MEKLLVGEYGDLILFDEENNSIVKKPESLECRSAFIAQNAGQVITSDEVVDYNAGEVVLILRAWHESTKKDKYKIVICSDLSAKDDLIEWRNSLIKQYETI